MSDIQKPGSHSRPFVSVPEPSRYYPAASHEEARLRIARSILRGEGPALLIGATGIGKTMLVEVLAEQFKNTLSIVPLAGAQLCTRRALLQMILFQVGLPYQNMDEGELRLSLLNFLNPAEGTPTKLLLLVDESESLPDRLLEELRVLTNISKSGQPLVSLVLAGNTTLEERFAEPQLETFSQRISSRSYLAPMGREETAHYVKAQVAASSITADRLFSDDALEAIFATTDGVPRLVNQLGDQLIWMAEETGFTTLDSDLVQQAWSELQQLPAPWNTPKEISTSAVEFGELDTPVFEPTNRTVEEELPASIPFNSSNSITTDSSSLEKLDVTEELLDQLSKMDSSPIAPSQTSASMSNNPFDEAFESEEEVIDQYSSFESQLLATAPTVENSMDLSFADQIQQFEISPKIAETYETSDHSSIQTDEVPSPVEFSTSNPLEMLEMEVAEPPVYDTSELLVIEEQDEDNVEVVPGKRFRQLFSSLHEESSQRCFG